VAFKGREPVRSKTVIDNKIIEQVNFFNYFGNVIPYEKEEDSDNIWNNDLKITGIMNMFRPQKLNENKNKLIQYTSPSTFVIR
jgi:hypothetical protein